MASGSSVAASGSTLKSKKSKTTIAKAATNMFSVRPAGAMNLHMIDVGGQKSERRKVSAAFLEERDDSDKAWAL